MFVLCTMLLNAISDSESVPGAPGTYIFNKLIFSEVCSATMNKDAVKNIIVQSFGGQTSLCLLSICIGIELLCHG